MTLDSSTFIERRFILFFIFVANILLFILAVLVYFGQDRDVIASQWIKAISSDSYLILKNISSGLTGFSSVEWVRYYFADMVWAFNFSSLFSVIWVGRIRVALLLFYSVLAASSFELLQAISVIKGTFDKIDLLLSMVIGLVTSMGVFKLLNES